MDDYNLGLYIVHWLELRPLYPLGFIGCHTPQFFAYRNIPYLCIKTVSYGIIIEIFIYNYRCILAN